jgi:hypothetical protein
LTVSVTTTLSSLESVQLDAWLTEHGHEVVGVEILPRCVALRGPHLYLSAEATALASRTPGQLTEALDEALERLRTEGGGC